MIKKRLLVTGANGQLGKMFADLAAGYSNYEFILAAKTELPLTDELLVKKFLEEKQPHFIINCGAYTAVDKAESDKETAEMVNGTAVGFLAAYSSENNSRLIHISTDYVFDGTSPIAYKEDDNVNPVNAYGSSKLLGEAICMEKDPYSIIIRTAWVFSQYGNNFVKTMLRLMKERDSLNIVADQTGAPTYAGDLAVAVMSIIESGKWIPGIYHYSNSGTTNWYEFARAIRDYAGLTCDLRPVTTDQYPTPAKRPAFSLLDTTKIRAGYNIRIPHWEDSLKKCLRILIPEASL